MRTGTGMLFALVLCVAPATMAETDKPGPQAIHEAGLSIGQRAPESARVLFDYLVKDGSGHWELLGGLARGIGLSGEFRDRAAALQPSDLPGEGDRSGATGVPAAGADAGGPAIAALPAGPPIGQPASAGEFGDRSFWLRLGAAGTPGVYMLADPACPHCANALSTLAPAIVAGEMHLRLALAPFLSPASRELAAEIMIAADPATAAWEMMLASANGRPPVPLAGPAAMIGPVGEALLASNLDWMRANSVSAVPHFIWQENGQWRQATGVQPLAAFAGAVVLEGDLAIHAPAPVLAMLPEPPAAAGTGSSE